jgi:uncharacterized protein (TIGR03437 family)
MKNNKASGFSVVERTCAAVKIVSLAFVALPLAAQVTVNTVPSRVFGQNQLVVQSVAPNLVEGRELNSPQGLAIDTAANPPALYVSDTGNNRVLAWRDAARFASGSKADLVIGQAGFTFTGCGGPNMSSNCSGPQSTVSTGLYSPTGLAVDARRNLYVVDSYNNRIVRFPSPFEQSEQLPDLIIGQTSRQAGSANPGGVSASTVSLCCGNGVLRASLAFDSQGNLYFTDSGNHRLLRYPASALGAGAANGPNADMVIGQPDFATNKAPDTTAENRLRKDVLRYPASLAIDAASGRTYVGDALSRVLVYSSSPRSGSTATRLMGISRPATGQQIAADITIFDAEGVVMIGDRPAVIDTSAHRVMIFPPFDQWPAETTDMPSPRALATGGLIGQSGFQLDNKANRNQMEPAPDSLSYPVAGAFLGDQLYIADAANHRVLAFPQQSSAFSQASRVLGQDGFNLNAPNLIEGKELWLVSSGTGRAGIAVDSTSNPPRLYIADTFNNRVLGFSDARKAKQGVAPDVVIGQPDLRRNINNFKSPDANNDRDTPAASSLSRPIGIVVDRSGNLWVADAGNGRVLRFPKPFEQSQQVLPSADLVIGQSGYTNKILDAPSATRMTLPTGLAFDADFGLFVSDQSNHRVLFFPAPYTSGMRATKVFGQSDFNSHETGSTNNRMSNPTALAVDSDGRLHVADTGNNRVLLFETGRLASETNQFAQNTISGLYGPTGIFVSQTTGEIWVADTSGARSARYPKFNDLDPTGQSAPTAVIGNSASPLAITQDTYGTLYILDAGNRMVLHFPPVVAVNGASFVNPFPNSDSVTSNFTTAIKNGALNNLLRLYPPLAPGMIASLFPLDRTLGGTTLADRIQQFNELPNPLPLPRELAGVQVLVNEKQAPLFFVAPGQINFQLPSTLPTSGYVDVRVERPATGQILAAGTIALSQAAPGLFTAEPTGTGQLKALNEDNTVNSASSPIARGKVIQLFGTGQGPFPGMPPDGEVTPAALVATDYKPRAIMQPGPTSFLDDKAVEFSGLTPGLVGVWQVNIRVPMEVTPGTVLVVLQYRGYNSNNPQIPAQIRTTIYVKQ